MAVTIAKAQRFIKNLPVGGDKTLIILKGHLLIEEVLTELLQECLKIGNPLDIRVGEKTNINSKLNLCWSLAKDYPILPVWTQIKKLNGIRNKMSHTVSPNGIDDLIDQFVESVTSHNHFIGFI